MTATTLTERLEDAVFDANQLIRAGWARLAAIRRAAEKNDLTESQTKLLDREIPTIHLDSK